MVLATPLIRKKKEEDSQTYMCNFEISSDASSVYLFLCPPLKFITLEVQRPLASRLCSALDVHISH